MFGNRRFNIREEDISESNCNIEKQLLYGKDIQQEKFWSQENSAKDKIFFQAGDGSQGFGMTDELLSKHLLLLGGIGSGKTNVINFIIDSLQKKMTDDDVMIIFDSKGDYKEKFLFKKSEARFNCT